MLSHILLLLLLPPCCRRCLCCRKDELQTKSKNVIADLRATILQPTAATRVDGDDSRNGLSAAPVAWSTFRSSNRPLPALPIHSTKLQLVPVRGSGDSRGACCGHARHRVIWCRKPCCALEVSSYIEYQKNNQPWHHTAVEASLRGSPRQESALKKLNRTHSEAAGRRSRAASSGP